MTTAKCFDPRSFDSWTAFLSRALRRSSRDLVKIFDAASVRELWFQEELLLAAKRQGMEFLHVNYTGLEDYAGAADLSYWKGHEENAELLMLAEVKFLGKSGYFPKNFTGNAFRRIARELQGEKLIVSPTSPLLKDCFGGLVGDYKRLISYRAQPNVLKMLVLVMDMRGEKSNSLGRILDSVEFEHEGEIVFQSKSLGIMCKGWEVRGTSLETLSSNVNARR